MQLLKNIVLFALLSLQSLGEPIRVVRSNYPADIGTLEARANPPSGYQNVDIGKTRRMLSGSTLFTNGLSSCIAIVVRNAVPGQSKEFDKILAHVSPTWCQTDENPSIDQQLKNIWLLYDLAPFPQPQAIVAYPPANGDAAQNAFNNYVIGQMQTYGSQRNCPVQSKERDHSRVNQAGGSRFWIDGNQKIYWSTFDTPFA
ncbi:hypothetical protein SCUP515_12795 [Seiridium cupressi]